ncbi:hypothetical protein GCM10020366_17910 [Saccharopolyspora gregorii]|uniref:Uncharacterized protein n=1 Tax=Saccharopolyspora gregorii TaxID=33914 RepID=A0ABP6RP78_9PSEU
MDRRVQHEQPGLVRDPLRLPHPRSDRVEVIGEDVQHARQVRADLGQFDDVPPVAGRGGAKSLRCGPLPFRFGFGTGPEPPVGDIVDTGRVPPHRFRQPTK